MSHSRAVAAMRLATLLWSMAGVVTRHLQAAGSFEATFWRAFFNSVALVVLLGWLRGWRTLATTLRTGGKTLWLSGACWSVMFTAFMVAITMTTVANVLVTMAIVPFVTALMARFVLGHRLPVRTWAAVLVAGVGIAWMFGRGMQAADARSLAGMGIAFAVPIASALNYTVLHHAGRSRPAADVATPGDEPDMLVAVLIGAAASALFALPIAWPFRSTAHDLALLAVLGVFQLAIPCLLLVRLTRELASPEIALLGLLEVIFGVLWAWLGAGEAPGSSALVGGALVVGALVGNELLSLRGRDAVAAPDATHE